MTTIESTESTEPVAKRSAVEWFAFVLVTLLLSVGGAVATMWVTALGTMVAPAGDPYLDGVMGTALVGWIGAIVAALVGAVVGVCTRRSIWWGYPFSVGIYFFATLAVLTMENT